MARHFFGVSNKEVGKRDSTDNGTIKRKIPEKVGGAGMIACVHAYVQTPVLGYR